MQYLSGPLHWHLKIFIWDLNAKPITLLVDTMWSPRKKLVYSYKNTSMSNNSNNYRLGIKFTNASDWKQSWTNKYIYVYLYIYIHCYIVIICCHNMLSLLSFPSLLPISLHVITRNITTKYCTIIYIWTGGFLKWGILKILLKMHDLRVPPIWGNHHMYIPSGKRLHSYGKSPCY